MVSRSQSASGGATLTISPRGERSPASQKQVPALSFSPVTDDGALVPSATLVELLPDEPVSHKSRSHVIETVQARSQEAHQAAFNKFTLIRQDSDAELQRTTLKNAQAVRHQLESIDRDVQAAIFSVSTGNAGPEGQAAARQLAEQINAHKNAQAQLCRALQPAFEVELARKQNRLSTALEVVTCQMMEAGVIRQNALQDLLCCETELLAASAADDRSTMTELVKMLLEDLDSKAAEAQELGQQGIAAWREAQTKQLLDSFKATLRLDDFSSLPKFRDAISSIGCAQQELRLALVQHLKALPDLARQPDGGCTGWKAQTDVLLSRWQAKSTAGLHDAAMHAATTLQMAGSAMDPLQSQVMEISSLSQEEIVKLIGAEAQPELDRLDSYFQNLQRCMATLLEQQTAGCLQTCKALADLLQDADKCCSDIGTTKMAAEESKDLRPESQTEAALDAVQSAATEEELEDRIQKVSTEQSSLATTMEARHEQLGALVIKWQQQLSDDTSAGLNVLYSFLGLKEVIEVNSSGSDLQTISENGKSAIRTSGIRQTSNSSQALGNTGPPSPLGAKGRRLSRQDSSIPEALPTLSMSNKTFEVISPLIATRFSGQPAEGEADGSETIKKASAKQPPGQKPETGKSKAKGKAAPAKTEADEPSKPSPEDEARQLLPTNADGQPLIDLDLLLAPVTLEEAIKQWQTALVECSICAANTAQAAASERSAQAQAAYRADADVTLTRLSHTAQAFCGEVRRARAKELKGQQRSLARHLAAQGRVRAEHQKLVTTKLTDIERQVDTNMQLLMGLSGQLGTCQSLQGIQLHCKRAQSLKAGVIVLFASTDKAFNESLPRFLLNHGGWSESSLEAAAAEMKQLAGDSSSKSQAILDEASASMEKLKSRASNIAADLEAAAPVHRRDLAFLDKLDRAQQSAAKACRHMLDTSGAMGSEAIAILKGFHLKMQSAQVLPCQQPVKLPNIKSFRPTAATPRTHRSHAAQVSSSRAPATSEELMEAAERLRMALLKQAINLDLLASTSLASALADGQKGTAAAPASAASKEAEIKAQKGAATVKAAGGTASISGPSPSPASISIMQRISQELNACMDAVQKACAAYYVPAVPEPRTPAAQSKPKTPAAAAGIEATACLPPTIEGPGAITRPALIMPNAAEMEKHCAGKNEEQRIAALAHVLQASDILQNQVLQSEQLLLELPETVLGRVAFEAGGSAQQALQDLVRQLLDELEVAMQPAAANRNQLHPTMARPSRRVDLDAIQSQEQERSLNTKELLRDNAFSALKAVATQAETASQKLEQQAVALMWLLDVFPLPADLKSQQHAPTAAGVAALPEPTPGPTKVPAQKAAKDAGAKTAPPIATRASRPFDARTFQANALSKVFDWDESDEYFEKLPPPTAAAAPIAAKSKASTKGSAAADSKASTATAAKPPSAVSKSGKQPANELPAPSSPSVLSLPGLDTMAHAAVGPSLSKAGEAVYGQMNACVCDMKQSFLAAAAEEDANAGISTQAEDGRDLRELTEANCPYPQPYIMPSGHRVQCCYNSTLTGLPCCDPSGNPCTKLLAPQDCCQDGADLPSGGSCWNLFHADGIDPGNYEVSVYGKTEAKQCIWDGGSANGHGRCYAPTLEASVWEGSFNQDLQVSASFGYDASTPYIRDGREYTRACHNKYSLTPKGDKSSMTVPPPMHRTAHCDSPPTPTPSPVPSPSPTASPSPVASPSPKDSPSPVPSPSPSASPSPVASPSPKDSPSPVPSPSPSASPSPVASPSPKYLPSSPEPDAPCDDDCDDDLKPLDPELEKYREEYPDSQIVSVKIHLGCDDDDEDCEEGSLSKPEDLHLSGPGVNGSDAKSLWTKDDDECSEDDADCNKSTLSDEDQEQVDYYLDQFPGQVKKIMKVHVNVDDDDCEGEDCDTSDDSCDCEDDDCDCEEGGDPEPYTCPEQASPTCPSEQQQGENECLACSKCFSRAALPGTVSVESYTKSSSDGQDIVTVGLLVKDDTSSGKVCAVRDVTLRLEKDEHWSRKQLVTLDENGPTPIYDSCCDASETGLKNSLYWELNKEDYEDKHVAISWLGSETGSDVFASSSKIDFSTSSTKPASSEDILYVLGTTCGCTYGTIPQDSLTHYPTAPPKSKSDQAQRIRVPGSSHEEAKHAEHGPNAALHAFSKVVTLSASGDVASLLTYPTNAITLTSTSQKVQMSVNAAGLSNAGSYCGIISFKFACGSSAVAAQQCVSALVGSMVQIINPFKISGVQATTSVTLSKNANNDKQIDAKLCIDVYSGSSWALPCSKDTMSALMSLKTAMGSGTAWPWSPSISYCDWTGTHCDSKSELTELDLANSGLNGIMPSADDLLSMPLLQRLDFSGNSLAGSIPSNLGVMRNLFELDLSNNKLSGCIPADMQYLSSATSVKLSGNTGLCGGIPYGVSQRLSLATDGTSLQYPCFSKDIDLLTAGQATTVISVSSQGFYVCGPGPVLLEYFNLQRIYYKITAEPMKGWISHVDEVDVALKVGDMMSLVDLMAGEYVYIRSLGQSGFDSFGCDVYEQPEVSVASFSSLMSSPQSLGRTLLESNNTAVGATSQDALLTSGMTFSVRDTAVAWGFAANTQVIRQAADGSSETVSMKEVAVNDTVLVASDSGTVAWDTVYLLAVMDTVQPHTYSQITIEGGARLQLSGLHYLPVSAVQGTKLSTAVYKEAYDVKSGDFLWTVNEWSSDYLYAAKVTENVNVTAYGDIMPLTMKGKIITNNLLASTSVNAATNNDAFAQAVEPLIGAYNVAVASGKLDSYQELAESKITSILDSTSSNITAAAATLMDVQFAVASSIASSARTSCGLQRPPPCRICRSTRRQARKLRSEASQEPLEQQQDTGSQQVPEEWAALAGIETEDLEAKGVPDLQGKLNELCNQGVRIMLGGDLNALGGFKDKLFEYGAVFTEADNKEATMFCYVLFRLAEHQVALAAEELTGNYKEAYEKMFGMLEDSGWQLKMEGDEEASDLLEEELLQPPAEYFAQGY
ncbi:hypothetical protein WJX74_005274 [Apatococcus lobatus]|uniref:Uncharacterized protein n=2 Tax=Apatococcus TaxID=904362 RepID=A0AAW1SBN7_9CHLO